MSGQNRFDGELGRNSGPDSRADLDRAFERDLRDTLSELGSEESPERLLARVRAIPRGEPHQAGLGGPRRLVTLAGLAAAAVVAAIVVGALLLPGVERPAASPSPSQTNAAIVNPSATPTASASESPSTASPTPTATAVPAPTLAAGGPVPADFSPLSVTFVSPDEGWVLGTASCGSARCTLVVQTLDAGRTWKVRGMPAVPAAAPSAGGAPAVATIRFADSNHGWLYGSELWVTNDGGATWTKSAIPGFGSGQIFGLEVVRGVVHAVGYSAANLGFVIATSAVGSGTWQMTSTTLPTGAGPVPFAQLVLTGGGDGWVIQNDRTVINGARFTGGAWKAWTPPCTDLYGLAALAASSNTDVLAVCDAGVWGEPPAGIAPGFHLYVSTNGGGSFTRTGPALPITSIDGVSTPAPTTIAVAGRNANAGSLVTASFDGGHTWGTVLTTAAGSIVDLGFTTTTQGVAVATGGNASAFYMTRDGGHTWTAVRFS